MCQKIVLTSLSAVFLAPNSLIEASSEQMHLIGHRIVTAGPDYLLLHCLLDGFLDIDADLDRHLRLLKTYQISFCIHYIGLDRARVPKHLFLLAVLPPATSTGHGRSHPAIALSVIEAKTATKSEGYSYRIAIYWAIPMVNI